MGQHNQEQPSGKPEPTSKDLVGTSESKNTAIRVKRMGGGDDFVLYLAFVK
jgi:hypothetical protein